MPNRFERRAAFDLADLLERPAIARAGMGQDLYSQFAQPTIDRKNMIREQAMAEQDQIEAERRAALQGMSDMLMGSALEAGTMDPTTVGMQAQSLGAGPKRTASLMSMLGGGNPATGGAPMGGMDDEDRMQIAQWVAAAAKGISPRTALAGVEAMEGPAISTEQTVQEIRSILGSAGVPPEQLDEAEQLIRSNYRTG